MALKRETSYEVEGLTNDQAIRVKPYPSLFTIHLVQNDGDYHNDKDSTIRVSFAQLPELIVALEELRTKHVPHEHISDPY